MSFIDAFFKKDRYDKKNYVDKLTGFYNRDYLKELERDFINKRYSLVLIDIDNFENINNYYGRLVADLLLGDIAKIIKNSIREKDIVVRFGADEFLILVEKDGANSTTAFGVGERITQKLDMADFKIEKNSIKITASAGIYLDPEKEGTLAEAINKVDKALLLAKQKGKNRVEVYRGNIENNINKRLLDIKEAIEENRIICFYQPIFDIESFKAVKYESLVRLLTKDRKIISPGMFLTQIVNTTVYKELTKKVIEYNLSTINQKNIHISINLLPSDILDKDLINYLLSISSRFKNNITIELLESENIQDYNILRDNVNRLRENGYKIALDDFGSGYSNLMHIVELRFDYLKIDGNIIRKIDKDPISYSIVKATKAFAKELNIDVVAEFISSKDIFDRVKEIGIKYGQGNFFKEAIPVSMIR